MYGLSTTCRGLGGNGEKQRPGGGPPFGFKEAWAWICPCLHLWGGGEHSLLEPGLGGIRWGFSLADLEVAWCGMRLWQCEE